jgi:hypothetical protein
VEQLDGGFRSGVGDRLVDLVACRDRAHRDRAVGEGLGHGDDVGHDREGVGGEGRTQPSETGDHLVEDEQDAMAVADRAEPLQIALRRDQRTGRTCDRFDKDRRYCSAAIGIAVTLQVVGEFSAMLRLAADEGLVGIPGVAQHDDIGHHHRKGFAVSHHARQ